MRLIIGLVGEPSSGKDTAADYLVQKHGFNHVSTGDLVREYMQKNKLGETTRPALKHTANQLRAEHGADYLARLAMEQEGDRLVVSGLRNPAEAEAVKAGGGKILALSAPLKQRYLWATERGRVGDELTFPQFKTQQAAEEASADANAQSVKAVVAMADHHINNDKNLEDLHQKIDQFISTLA